MNKDVYTTTAGTQTLNAEICEMIGDQVPFSLTILATVQY